MVWYEWGKENLREWNHLRRSLFPLDPLRTHAPRWPGSERARAVDSALILPKTQEAADGRRRGPRPKEAVTLQTVSTPVVWMPLVEWSDLLWHLPVEPKRNFRLAPELLFWRSVMDFAYSLLARGRFAPGWQVEEADRPRWEPLLLGEDRLVVESLLAAIPMAAWQPTWTGKTPPSPRLYLTEVIRLLMEGWILRWAGESAIRGPERPSTAAAFWVQGLLNPSSRPKPLPRSATGEMEQIGAWIQQGLEQVIPELDVVFRTVLRLQEPPEGSDTWRLDLHLLSTGHEETLLPASAFWERPSSENGEIIGADAFLRDLQKAATRFPPLEQALSSPRPVGVDLSTQEAYALAAASDSLEREGIALALPWQQRERIGMQLRVRAGERFLGLQDLLDFEWRLSLGETGLTDAEFHALAEAKIPLVRLAGRWVEVDLLDLESTLAAMRQPQRFSVAAALRLALTGQDEERARPVTLQSEGWFRELLQRLQEGERLAQQPLPTDFAGQLRPYQIRGFSWLDFLRRWRLGACLADDMGLGKTVQTIALLLREKETEGAGPSLLICPTSVIGNWQHEVARFGPSLRVQIHHGTGRQSEQEFSTVAREQDLVITSYGLAHRDQATLQAVEWNGLILDEAHHIKNPQTRQAQAIRDLPCRFRIALTGTPVENRLTELWAVMEFLNPGYLGSRASFQERYATPIEKNGDTARAERLRQIIRPFVLRRLKTDPLVVQDLPEKWEHHVYCTLTEEQAALYEAVVQEMLGRIEDSEGIRRRGQILSALTRLKQICDHPALFLKDDSPVGLRSGKVTRLEEMLEEVLAEGDKALIFTQFARFGHLLAPHLQERLGTEVLFLHGGVPAAERSRMVERFQEPGGPALFILTLKAGGVGLNLTAASHVFHVDRWWNPAVENQATDRAFRLGQTRRVQVHKFVISGTLEERIDALIGSKADLLERVVGNGEGWLTELSTEQIQRLITLEQEPLGGRQRKLHFR